MSLLDDLEGRIERSAAIGEAAPPVHDLIGRVIGNSRWRDLLAGRGLGHPAHPAVVGVPIGAWTSAFACDLARKPEAARYLTGLGTVAAIPAALTGLSDWADTEGAEQRVGFVHLSLNIAATALYGWSWRRRRRGRHASGVILSLLGASLASVAGWLGGHLAYGMGVGVDTNAFRTGPTEWSDAGAEPRTGTGAEKRTVEGVDLVVVDDGRQHRVLAERCSHRGGPLSEGEVADGCISCPWHGSRFDVVSGRVRRGPATVTQPTYEAQVVGGQLRVRREEGRALRQNVV